MSHEIEFVDYTNESMLKGIQELAAGNLSEPYSVFTYRYFLHNWPQLCICAYSQSDSGKQLIGTIVCKLEGEENQKVGYIAMLVVQKDYRKRGIAVDLVEKAIDKMKRMGGNEVVLETEASNKAALGLYSKLGFMKEEKLGRYYLNGGDAFRLKLIIDKNPYVSTEQI